MFGEYLKKRRLELGLTQPEMARTLNLADPEFAAVDPVTVSRWERGASKPNPAKVLRILRCITTDLTEYISLLPNPNSSKEFDAVIQARFRTHLNKLLGASYEVGVVDEELDIIELPLLSRVNDPMLEHLKTFYQSIDYIPPGILNVDLYAMQATKRAICKRFISGETNQTQGHSISFIFELNYFENKIKEKKFDIDINEAVPYQAGKLLSCVNYSRFSRDSDVFRCMFASQIRNLMRFPNVRKYYFFNAVPNSSEFFENIGFDKIAVDKPTKDDGFKLGRKNYEYCLYKIDTSTLISHPEIITLLKNTRWKGNHR